MRHHLHNTTVEALKLVPTWPFYHAEIIRLRVTATRIEKIIGKAGLERGHETYDEALAEEDPQGRSGEKVKTW